MASPSPLLLITHLLILSTRSSSAQGLPRNVTLAGVVTCSNSSLATAKTYSVIPQARVEVVCGILIFQRVTKSTTTNIAGIYSLSFTPLETVFNNPELCHLRVTIPAGSCTFDPPGGAIRFPIIAIRSGIIPVAYIPGAPTYVPMGCN